MHNIKIILSQIFLTLLTFNTSAQNTGRINLSLSDDWEFAKCSNAALDTTITNWEKISIPHTWNAQDMQDADKDFYEGYAIYKRSIYAEKEWENKRVFIRFEGVGQVAELFINDRYLGQHEGSYSAFVFDLSYDLKYGEKNKIVVRVNNMVSKKIIPTTSILFGIYGGIYRPSSLIITNRTNITTTDYASSGIYITQKDVAKESATIKVLTKLESIEKNNTNMALETAIYDNAGKQVAKKEESIVLSPQGRKVFTQDLTLTKPRLWHGKKDPYLYTVVVSLKNSQGNIVDQVTQPLGVRKFEIKGAKGFFLNEEKYDLYGVSRHQDWFDSGNALGNWQHDKDLELIKEIGATTIRLAHYQQSEYFYKKCDSIGFIIWAEIPFVKKPKGGEDANAKLQMEELIKQNFNHPSIYIWGIHNEVYQDHPSDYGAVLTRDLNEIAKTIDPDRPTASVNGHANMDHPMNRNADVQGMNLYFGWYEGHMGDLKKWVEGLEEEYPEHAVILAEYGAGANIEHQVEKVPEKVKPGGDFFPESYATRFHETQWGDIANQDYLIASYVWNMFDFAVPRWSRGGVPARNHKGLVSYDRKTKKDAFFWYKANWNPEPMVYISDRRVTQRTNPVTDINVYCNTSNLILTVNGKKLKTVVEGKTNVHYIFKDVALSAGENVIKVTAGKQGAVSDEIVWVLEE